MIDATYITLVNPNEINMSLLQLKHHYMTSYHGKMEVYELHELWFIVQLQENAHLQKNVSNYNNRNIKANITYKNPTLDSPSSSMSPKTKK